MTPPIDPVTRQKVIDLLAMSRFANLPTVWSNGLLGAVIGYIAFAQSGHVCPICLTLIGLSLSFLYLGGCFFNDWHDLDFDQKTRPDRPIPSGRWSRGTVLGLATSLMTGGLALAFMISSASALFAAGIIICILAYTRWHKIHPASFIFMAGARALIYPLAAFSFLDWEQFILLQYRATPVLIVLALGLGGYILGISLLASAESSEKPVTEARRILPVFCLCSPVVFISAPLILANNGFALIPLAIFLAAIAFCVRRLRATGQIGTFVSRALAFIPLVDFLMLGSFARQEGFGIFWIISPLLVLAALGLQKIAPAT